MIILKLGGKPLLIVIMDLHHIILDLNRRALHPDSVRPDAAIPHTIPAPLTPHRFPHLTLPITFRPPKKSLP